LAEGRIKGAGRIKLEKLQPMPDTELPRHSATGFRLNRSFYSEGIERRAIDRWKQGEKDEAIRILRIGLTYPAIKGRSNIRLYDLLAGLLIRMNRDEEVRKLATEILARRGNWPDVIDSARRQRRVQAWTAPDGKWRRKWTEQKKTWDSIDL
jgi:hypothetical protein